MGLLKKNNWILKNHFSYKLESHSVMLESQGRDQHTLK